ncbi:MAG TPA: R3H domain-containing nucleic acid-binding protein [Thermoanaerobaculia bacterium]|nr:R3H domain-containing nucleic acid-binding protein [Thermoanaerobaculia bacterium]
MSGPERRFFSGATLAQALMTAARHHHLAPEEIAYRERDRRHGFTHRVRGVVIEVDPLAPRRKEPAPASTVEASGVARPPVADAPPARPAAMGSGRAPRRQERPELPRGEQRLPARRAAGRAEPAPEHLPLAEEAAQALIALLAADLAPRAELGKGRVRVVLEGPDADWLVGQGPELLGAFEELLRRMLRTPDGRLVPVEADCRGVREERAGELRSLAIAAATAVRRTGRPVLLDPLPPAERRLIHLALADAVDLETESLGHGREKPLEIRLRAGGPAPQTP